MFGAVGPDDPSTRSALAALATLPPPIRSQVLTVDATVAGSGVPGQVTFGLTDNRQVVWGTDDRAAEKAAVLVPAAHPAGARVRRHQPGPAHHPQVKPIRALA